ncbi:MAG: hypothetical protein LIP08_14120 [Bacteroides sp.]|nr:hypothetical protein [Bacteroides sp.]
MKKYIALSICMLLLLAACNSDDDNRVSAFAPDTENNRVEGSFVQGAALTTNCQVVIHYVNASGGTATFWSDEVNGMSAPETQVEMEKGEGVAKINVTGTPIELGMTHLPVYINYQGTTYETTVSFTVFEDDDPSGTIEFTLSDEPLLNMDSEKMLPFTVSPTMAAVTVEDIPGMVSSVTQDVKTGTGTITLTPSADLLSGVVEVTATFGARPAVVKAIVVNAFAGGEGTEEAPYEVGNTAQLLKISAGVESFYKLTEDITVEGEWSPVGTQAEPFAGGLNGNDHQITFGINAPEASSLGFFGYVAAGAVVKDLTLKGAITGKIRIGGFAAHSDVAPVNCTIEVEVKGENHLAACIADGAAKDDRVLIVGEDFPALLNIPAGAMELEESLDIRPIDAEVEITANPTHAQITYDGTTGRIRVDISNGGFTRGEITLEVSLSEQVSLLPIRLMVDSKQMFESGTGVAGDPYIVTDGGQLALTTFTYPGSYIALGNDITMEEAWTPIEEFTGDLDGKDFTVSGLVIRNTAANGGLVRRNKGTIHDIKFTQVDIHTTASFGTVTGYNTGTIENVEVRGTLISDNTGDILGGIAGENREQGVIHNCYVNATMEAYCGMTGGIVGRNSGSGSGASVTRCTSEGTLTVLAGKNRIAGIVGRGEGPDLIKGCHSSMTIVATASGANGVGGIFGANNNNNMRIEECMFTGSIKSGNDVGGIAGVGVNVTDCLVVGAVIENTTSGSNGNAADICGTGKYYTRYSIVRDARISGIVGSGKAVSGINGNYQNDGTTFSCVVANTEVKGGKVQRVSAMDALGAALQQNWTSGVTLLNSEGDDITGNATDDPSGLDGGMVTAAEMTQSWYESLGYDFGQVWKMENNQPVLRNVGYESK